MQELQVWERRNKPKNKNKIPLSCGLKLNFCHHLVILMLFQTSFFSVEHKGWLTVEVKVVQSQWVGQIFIIWTKTSFIFGWTFNSKQFIFAGPKPLVYNSKILYAILFLWAYTSINRKVKNTCLNDVAKVTFMCLNQSKQLLYLWTVFNHRFCNKTHTKTRLHVIFYY